MAGVGHPDRHEVVEVECRRTKVAELYIQRWTQSAIAVKFGLSQQTIFEDLQAIRKEWREARVRDIDELQTEELERIGQREREAWEAWNKSKAPTETMELATYDGRKSERLTSKTSAGDPRFLDKLEKCSEQRCKIYGLYKIPDKPESPIPPPPSPPTEINVNVNVKTRQELLNEPEYLGYLRHRTCETNGHARPVR